MLHDPNLLLVDVMKGTYSEIQTGGFSEIKINKAKKCKAHYSNNQHPNQNVNKITINLHANTIIKQSITQKSFPQIHSTNTYFMHKAIFPHFPPLQFNSNYIYPLKSKIIPHLEHSRMRTNNLPLFCNMNILPLATVE